MSAIRGFPDNPDAARLKGACFRSGQLTTVTLAVLKLDSSAFWMIVASSSNGGGSRGCFVTIIVV